MTSLTKSAHLLYVPAGAEKLQAFVQELINLECLGEKLLAAYDLYKVSKQGATQMQERKPRGERCWYVLERELEVRTEAHYRLQRCSSLLKTIYLHLEEFHKATIAVSQSVVELLWDKDVLNQGGPNTHRNAMSIKAAIGYAAVLLRECSLITEQVGVYIWVKEGRIRSNLVVGKNAGSLFTFHDSEFGNWNFEGGWAVRATETGRFGVGESGSRVYVNGPVSWEDEFDLRPDSRSQPGLRALAQLSVNPPAIGMMTQQEAGNCLILWMVCVCERECYRLGFAPPDLRKGRKENALALFEVCQILLDEIRPEIYNPENGQTIGLSELLRHRIAAA